MILNARGRLSDPPVRITNGIMESEFWESRWSEGKIGFHRTDPNPALLRHAEKVSSFPGTVLVPLCGKSVDMRWLAEEGARVVGIEWVGQAVREFFEEQKLQARVTQDGPLERWEAEELPITLYRGDVFDLQPRHVSEVRWVYDRASMVALPPDLRKDYGAHLNILPRGVELLLLVFEYDPSQMQGPPFSVPAAEVLRCLPDWELECLEWESLAVPEHLAQGGLTGWGQRVWSGRRSG